jgi:hypothetical protein
MSKYGRTDRNVLSIFECNKLLSLTVNTSQHKKKKNVEWLKLAHLFTFIYLYGKECYKMSRKYILYVKCIASFHIMFILNIYICNKYYVSYA